MQIIFTLQDVKLVDISADILKAKLISLLPALYEHGAWSLTLRDELSLSDCDHGAEKNICSKEGVSNRRLLGFIIRTPHRIYEYY